MYAASQSWVIINEFEMLSAKPTNLYIGLCKGKLETNFRVNVSYKLS